MSFYLVEMKLFLTMMFLILGAPSIFSQTNGSPTKINILSAMSVRK